MLVICWQIRYATHSRIVCLRWCEWNKYIKPNFIDNGMCESERCDFVYVSMCGCTLFVCFMFTLQKLKWRWQKQYACVVRCIELYWYSLYFIALCCWIVLYCVFESELSVPRNFYNCVVFMQLPALLLLPLLLLLLPFQSLPSLSNLLLLKFPLTIFFDKITIP